MEVVILSQSWSVGVRRNGDVVDMDEVIKVWARQVFSTSNDKGIHPSAMSFDVNWNRALIVHDNPRFPDNKKPPTPKEQVLFKATYNNDTKEQQGNRFHAQRTTRSKAQLKVFEGACFHKGIEIPLPGEVARANAGFPQELNICKMVDKSWEEELTWEVDNNITVGPGDTIHAKLIVKESQYDGDFSIKSTFSGKITVVVRRKDTDDFVTNIRGDLGEIFRRAQQSGLDVPGLSIVQGKVSFVTRGNMNFRYGVEQQVDVKSVRRGQNVY